MAILENPSAENFPSPGLAEQAQPLPYGENLDLFWNYEEHSEVQQLQKGKEMMRPESNDDDHDSFNIDDYLLEDVLDVPTQSPGRMVVSSPRMTNSSDDSLGSFDPGRLWGDNEYSVVVQMLQNWQTFKPCSRCFITLNPCKPRKLCVPAFLLHLEWLCQNMVVEVGKGEEIMRINVRKAYLEVDFASEENYPVCVSSEAQAPESWGEMTERNFVSRRYRFCSKTHCWNVILQLLGVAVRVLLYLGLKNYTFGISIRGDHCTKMQKLVCLGRTFLNYVQMPHLHNLQRLFLCHLERCAVEGVARLLSRKEIKVRYLEFGSAPAPSRLNHTTTVAMLPGLESECFRGMVMQHTPSTSYHCPIPAMNDAIAISNRSKEKGTTSSRQQKDSGITLDAIAKVLDKTLKVAAETLHVSPSTLKRACRKFGIPNWRERKRAKKLKGSQQCPPPPEQAGTATLQGNSAMDVKLTYKNNTVRFPLSSSSTMKYLVEQLETRFQITLDNFFIKYQDEEDEWITLMCDSDLSYLLYESVKFIWQIWDQNDGHPEI
nr:protein NLP7-like [Ipomoea batatas]